MDYDKALASSPKSHYIFKKSIEASKKIETLSCEKEKLLVLYKLIKLIMKYAVIKNASEVYSDNLSLAAREELANWDKMVSALEYYSDRWNTHRLEKVICGYNSLNLSDFYFKMPYDYIDEY